MPVAGGSASSLRAGRLPRVAAIGPVWVTGFGEHLTHQDADVRDRHRRDTGRSRVQAGVLRWPASNAGDVDAAEIYDCYTITVLLTLEDAGFCGKGDGMDIHSRSRLHRTAATSRCNTHGGQLGVGQAGLAGGMTQPIEAVRQIMGRAGDLQLGRCDTVYVSGTGGVMSEQAALILQGG